MLLYWIDTRLACGGVMVKNNVIVRGVPIFKKLIGCNILKLAYKYKVKLVEGNWIWK